MMECGPKTETNNKGINSLETRSITGVKKDLFGKMPDGTDIFLFTLTNRAGVTMRVTNYGGIIVSLMVPDKTGKFEDVVLGYDSLTDYVQRNRFFGALIGRYGNRIAGGKFQLDGTAYQLAQNNFGNHLHGGPRGFDKVVWAIEELPSAEGVALKLSYLSKDGEENYPGNLRAEVTYTLTHNDELKLDYRAVTDKTTIVNLTQHTYFNLNGNTKADILQHELTLNADKFVPVDQTLIPTGELKNVADTPFDFKTPHTIGSRIDTKDQQLEFGAGYDHCWVLRESEDTLKHAATLYEPTSGRVMTVHTTEPGIQFYSGNFLDGSLVGKYDVAYKKRYGLCLETEHFPDSPNHNTFPSVVLRAGEVYTTRSVYAFSVKK
ncbi:MAG: aldose epimerase family protein [Bacteroidota bacterium]